jgi:hypothetical protein
MIEQVTQTLIVLHIALISTFVAFAYFELRSFRKYAQLQAELMKKLEEN